MSDVPVIAIDGPSGSGKGAITQRVALTLGFHILDSGALYRLIGLSARLSRLDLGVAADMEKVALQLDASFLPTGDPEDPLTILLGDRDVTRDIRSDEAGRDASTVAAYPEVRTAIGKLQHGFRKPPGLVADGRDMGTEVFTDAVVKIYLTASAEARAERRYNQLKDKDIGVSLHALFLSIQERDKKDMERTVAPLRPADDAFVIDSTLLSIDEVESTVMQIVRERLG